MVSEPSSEDPDSEAEGGTPAMFRRVVDVRRVYQAVGFPGLTTQSEDEGHVAGLLPSRGGGGRRRRKSSGGIAGQEALEEWA